MEKEDKIFKRHWQQDKEKNGIRVTLYGKAANFVGKQAIDDFGLGQSTVSLELSKLILIAKDCIEKGNTEKWKKIVDELESFSDSD